MTDYHAIAAKMTFPNKVLTDRKEVVAKSGATFETRDPATSDVLASLPACSAASVGIIAYSEGEISTPFGGFKTSGFGGATTVFAPTNNTPNSRSSGLIRMASGHFDHLNKGN